MVKIGKRVAVGVIFTVWAAVSALGIGVQLQGQELNAQSSVSVPKDEVEARSQESEALKILFLGDQAGHQPESRFYLLDAALKSRGFSLTYTEDLDDLTLENLQQYDALLLYANIDNIEDEPANALLDYVAGGGGFVPVHCASFCFRNSPDLVALMGAQFLRHGTGVFRTEISAATHPIMSGFDGFESWDETYVHHLHNEQGRTVLAYRVDREGREPWTWIRTHGQGRVFYTAWGHDQRTWRHPGFHNLLERGIRWASAKDPSATPRFHQDRDFPVPEIGKQPDDLPELEYIDVGNKIPNYKPGGQWGAEGQNVSQMQRPLSPADSKRRWVLPAGFRMELFATEPMIRGKPIFMTWDAKGRLWVAETTDYPNELQTEGRGRDRIRILEDTDGDWVADQSTVFAENLSIPTTFTFHKDGIIIQDGAHTKLIRDTDGDDRADQTEVIFKGWSLGDTHGGVSNFQYGMDNWIWAMQGYNPSRPVNESGARASFRQGFFRFRPDGSEIEFLRSTNNNTWGLGISEEGLIFGSTANGCPSVYMPIPNRYYERVQGWTPSLVLDSIAETHLFAPITKNIRQVDWHGGYTAGAGHALYTARNYPPEYWNRTAFVCGPTGHLVGTFVLNESNSNFKSKYSFNLVASDDQWSAPIMAEVGPDGNVWVLDWYNYIVQHNPTPNGFETGKGNAYETDLRDKKFGRIYRVVYEPTDKSPADPVVFDNSLDLSSASADQLVETLSHPNMLWRKHAQRLIVEGQMREAVGLLRDLVVEAKSDQIGIKAGATHAIWTLQGLGYFSGSDPERWLTLEHALQDPARGVRRAAIQVLPRESKSVDLLVASGVLTDRDAHVRLAALLAISDLPASATASRAIFDAWSDMGLLADGPLADAMASAAAHNGINFLVLASQQTPDDQWGSILAIVAEHEVRSNKDAAIRELLTELSGADPAAMDALLHGISRGWPRDAQIEIDEVFERSCREWMARLAPANKSTLIKLLMQSTSNEVFADLAEQVANQLSEQVADASQPVADRITAAREYVQFRGKEIAAVTELLELLNPQIETEFGIGLVRAVNESRAEEFGETLTGYLSGMTPQVRRVAIDLMVQRADSVLPLVQQINNGKVLLSELSLQQQQNLANHQLEPVRKLSRAILERGGALPNPDRQKVLDEMMEVTELSGDASAGKITFTKSCANCHQFRGEGQKVGPDLTGMAVHPKEELLTHILDPNRDVEGNYRRYSVLTMDGQMIDGLLAAESRTSIELVDSEGKKHVVLREDIDEFEGSANSIMPEGFEKDLAKQDLANLLEFLTQRGQFIPVPFQKLATISSARGMFIDNGPEERLILDEWGAMDFNGIPFHVLDPDDGETANVIELFGPLGGKSRGLPKSVRIPCNGPVRRIHMLGGISGWGFPYNRRETVSMIVRIHYQDGETEDHELINGQHFADYIRRVDVPKSEFALAARSQQIRYLAIDPQRKDVIEFIELIKGPDSSAPVTVAITFESIK